jgi:uncharacterized protein YecE (DUF72 family)
MEFGAGIFEDFDFLKTSPFPLVQESKNIGLSLGLPQWGLPEWKGIIYPKDLKPQDFLEHFAKLYSCVEVSSTFYASVEHRTLEGWKEKVGAHFKFLPKWPKRLTHELQLQASSKEIKSFVESMELLNPHLGTTILQLPSSFSYEHRRALFLFLEQIPKGFPICLELRHSSWFESRGLRERLYQYLCQREIGLVVTDTPQRRDLFHLNSSGPQFLVRYLSDGVESTDEMRLLWWKKALSEYENKTNCFFIFHKPNNILTPELAQYLDHGLEKTRKELIDNSEQLGLF